MSEIEFPLDSRAISLYQAERQKFKALQGDARRQAQKKLIIARRDVMKRYTKLVLQRAIESPDQEEEALAWFWFNHFNVFWRKDLVGAALPDYVDRVIRPHVRGQFRDMLLGVVTSPAMLVYLDNIRNVKGKINENLARELLELHTLGVDSGYTQRDVQEVARILTGLGLRSKKPEQFHPEQQPLVRREGEFIFNPAKHETGPKQVLGKTIEAEGFAEIEELLDLLVAHPATGQHLSRKLGLYLLGDAAPEQAVQQAAAAFTASGGDLHKTVEALRQGAAKAGPPAGATFKDPYRYVTSAVQLLRADKPLKDATTISGWLGLLGEPLFACTTPDGYSLRGSDWIGSGQLAQRIELSVTLVAQVSRYIQDPLTAEQLLARPEVVALKNSLRTESVKALESAENDRQRLELLLSGPEFMYWRA